MDTSKLKKFAQHARRSLREQVGSKLNIVLAADSPERRETPASVEKLEGQIKASNKDHVIEKVAYIWFNRFCALRFMDVNQYNRINVLSPLEGQFQPEILAEAKAGHIDDSIVNESARKKIFGLLDDSLKSRDGQAEAFRLLIVAVCNDYNRIMPYLFERIEDYTELLMPDDLLSGNSILAYTREAMTPEACESVESIGWLYQFYISEKKDEVFETLKKNKKITPENIPAATQLFTPHWIVRYLVENSLGRLWMLNNPKSKVIEKMDYYIKPVENESDYLKISSPEEIKICDPACGSGHMLTYAYDLLFAIYLDAGFDSVEIPEKILVNNLYGIEIDERAAELAAFALTMKAIKGNPLDDGNNRRRFFRSPIAPNICCLEKVTFSDEELDNYIDFAGNDLFTQDLRTTLREFEEADNFGALIRPTLKTPAEVLSLLEAKDIYGHNYLEQTHKSVLKVLKQSEYLRSKYHVVIANPPYLGGKGMNQNMARWLKVNYADVKSDLFAAFIVRNTQLALDKGQLGFMTPFVWMFISSYEKLRTFLITKKTISSLIQLEYSGFDGATVPICTFTLENSYQSEFKGGYVRLSDFKGASNQAPRTLEAIENPECGWFYRASAENFKKIPGSPISYSLSRSVFKAYAENPKISELGDTCSGLQTSDNNRFLRQWYEVSFNNIEFNVNNSDESKQSLLKWYPHKKGGPYRKWYGNNDYVLNWESSGKELHSFAKELYGSPTRIIKNTNRYYQSGITWSHTTSSRFSARTLEESFIFNVEAPSLFDTEEELFLPYLCSSVGTRFIELANPTLHFVSSSVGDLPFAKEKIEAKRKQITEIYSRCVRLAKNDWDSYELSWCYFDNPLIINKSSDGLLSKSFVSLKNKWGGAVGEMASAEKDNNEIFTEAFGLGSEVDSEVSLKEITLTCNPQYRYGGDKSAEELNRLLLADTVREFISHAVGCLFGRYSLDNEGLILASQGDTIEDYIQKVPSPSFMPDDDNVIPLIDFEGDWFEDDISERFKQFLKIAFGEEHFSENLIFIEKAIGRDIKKFFLKDFYTDHVKRYKKRPIYWMFSSPKGSFNTLIYMHRYRTDTASVVLNDYLREFRTKLEAKKASYEQVEISASASQAEKTKAIKLREKINAAIDEINDYERETLYPLASQNIEIDLDDGVKHNYPLFGKALKKVPGLS